MPMVTKKVNPLTNALIIVGILVVIAVSLLPYVWMVLTSLKTRVDLLSTTPKWIFKPTFDNYIEAFIGKKFLFYLRNSVVVGLLSLALSLVIGLPCAYAISRFEFGGKGHFFFYILTTRMAPPVAFALPMYILFSKIGILGTHLGLVLAHSTITLSFVTWIMKSFFDDIPIEIDQAALTDGYTQFGTFLKVILPMIKPGIVATSLFAFISSWNEFLFALVLGGKLSRTLPSAIPGLVTPHGTLWGQVAAAGTVITVPVIVMAFLLQKHLVRGLSFGAVKG